jgi:DNA polymerase-3 subunit epsilon
VREKSSPDNVCVEADKLAYTKDGRVTHVVDTFGAFNEPSVPIPALITKLTGIDDAMVSDHRIDPAAVASFVDDAIVVIAHNAQFDRQFSERFWPEFTAKAWACSATQVDWRGLGFEGSGTALAIHRRRF